MKDSRFFRWPYTVIILSLLWGGAPVWGSLLYGSKDIGAIWFIGDSITQSNADGDASGSPRKSLYDLLKAHGYQFSYTGHWTKNTDGLPSTVRRDGRRGTEVVHNEEELYHYHSGVSASVIGDNYGNRVGMTQNLDSFWSQGRLVQVKPDVILIMLGTNDVGNNLDLVNAPGRLETLVQKIYDLPGVGSPTLFLASIPPSRRSAEREVEIDAFNRFVPEIVAGFQTQGKDVHFVDMFTPLNNNYATCMRPDNLHPNAKGNDIMAEQWFKGIEAVVNNGQLRAICSVTPRMGQAPLDVTFDASGSRSPVDIAAYDWDLGDGHHARGAIVNHRYSQIGTYTVTLTVTDSNQLTDTAVVEIDAIEWPGQPTDFHGYPLYQFDVNSLSCKIAVPEVTAEGKPWVWRARFWGHQPGPEIELLRRGFHVVYVDVADLYGAPAAVARFDAFYDFLVLEHGFDCRAVLEGMSRGGLIVYNWAAQNPDKVHCIYADAPVCDFKSWPGINDAIMNAYGFETVEQAEAYPGNPIDNLGPLAAAGIPLLHVVGDLDTTVPVAENTAIVEERYLALGGQIEVIHKPNAAHKHGLEDPTPIVEFILKGMSPLYNLPATEGGRTIQWPDR